MKATDWFTVDAVPEKKADLNWLQRVSVRAAHVASLSRGPLVGYGEEKSIPTVRLAMANQDIWLIPVSEPNAVDALRRELEIE